MHQLTVFNLFFYHSVFQVSITLGPRPESEIWVLISRHAACERLMENKKHSSDWNRNGGGGSWFVYLPQLSLVIYGEIIQSYTKFGDKRGAGVEGQAGV